LEKLQLESLNVKMGAGQVIVYLPEKGASQIHISMGAGQVSVHSATGTSLSIKCTTGLGNCALPNGAGFWDRTFTSPDFDSASNRSDVDVTVGAGSGIIS
jgi:hypothetical protein